MHILNGLRKAKGDNPDRKSGTEGSLRRLSVTTDWYPVPPTWNFLEKVSRLTNLKTHMNTTNNKMALSPGQIVGANNLPVRIATWNTRTLKETDTIYIILHETERMGIDIIGITETHWTSDIPTIWEKNGHIIIHSPRQDGICRQGVALILKKHLGEKIENYKAISSRLLKVTMEWESERVTYFIVYAPDSSYDDLIVEEFFGTLQEEMNLLPPTDIIVLLGYFNASVGNNMKMTGQE